MQILCQYVQQVSYAYRMLTVTSYVVLVEVVDPLSWKHRYMHDRPVKVVDLVELVESSWISKNKCMLCVRVGWSSWLDLIILCFLWQQSVCEFLFNQKIYN